MADFDDLDYQDIVEDLADNPILTDAISPVSIPFSGQRLTAGVRVIDLKNMLAHITEDAVADLWVKPL